MNRALGLLMALTLAAVGCGSSNDAQGPVTTTQAAQSASASAAPIPALVGRWEMVTTCQRYVNALNSVGLGALAPGVIAGNGWMSGSAEQLAHKPDLCRGAVPSRVHSHFFDQLGQFGSVDWRNQQVDNGKYKIIDDHTFTIGHSTFHYRIIDGSLLTMTPAITAAMKQLALADPTGFSAAGWMVAVALPGYTWHRVACAQWC